MTVETRAQLRIAAERAVARAGRDVVGHEKIEVAIAIEIREGAASAPQRRPDTSGSGHISEHAVAAVAVQNVRSEVRDVQIDPAIVVEVARARAHPVFG